jgi:hypothetical protein
MKTFNDLKFRVDPTKANRQRAKIDLDIYSMSVVFGDGVYGKGPAYDSYEVAVWECDRDDFLHLSEDSDVLGWQNEAEITNLMKILQTEPDFGKALRVLKRTKYARKYSNNSHMSAAAFN